ncbi:MAG: hypothetical protein II458_05510 [Oscillospiraceae bacterium]|nr:hypothetical protein [Oscillospiraceae bacterium]
MDDLLIFIVNAILTVAGFFVVAPVLLSAISTFTVQKRFAETMIQEGVIEERHVREIQPKKQVAGVIIAALVIAAAVLAAKRVNYGYICLSVGFLVGLLKYRQILQFNTLTVKRFQNAYGDNFNAEKLNKYIDRMF